jgi:AraC-like DNA-binding protein
MAANGVLAVFCMERSYLSLPLLAPQPDGTRLRYVGNTDRDRGGASTVQFQAPDGEHLRYAFRLAEAGEYPFAGADLLLNDSRGRLAQADWAKYSSVSFVAKCSPANSILFSIQTFDEKLSRPGDFDTYRMPQAFFSCHPGGVAVTLDLSRLSMPEWWFGKYKLPVALTDYKLDKVSKISFGTSFQSPRNTASQVEISGLVLHGRDFRYVAALAVLVLAGWGVFAAWFFRAHARALTASVESRVMKNLPLVAYRQLTLEPHRDKQKAMVLRYIANNYADPGLDMDAVVAATGCNRNKINDLLKGELGMTLGAYLNKLRLAEAARLLSEEDEAAVSEIAYSVGYGNVPYFNKLFKEEYGCAPKVFRALSRPKA